MRFSPLFRDQKFLHAVAVLIGTMVGVGMYGIPFAFAKSGALAGLAWLALVAALMMVFNLLFAELTLRTEGKHQVVGYANIWLGPWGRRVMMAAYVLSMYGALLAYMIVAGQFLHNIFSQFIAIDPQLYSILFAGVWSLAWLMRLRTVAALELGMVGMYVGTTVLLVGVGAFHVQPMNLSGWTPEYWWLPYGVLLFAFSGISAIPLQRQLLAGRERLMKPAIITAIAVVAVLYALFAITVVGISGEVTTPESLAGLFSFMGTPIVIIGSVLGMMTISTAFVVLGTSLWETYRLDYGMRPLSAWLLALLPPVALFAVGMRNFIDVIGLVGSVAVGVQSVLMTLAYLRARKVRLRTPEFSLRIPAVVVIGIALVFAAGAFHEFFVR